MQTHARGHLESLDIAGAPPGAQRHATGAAEPIRIAYAVPLPGGLTANGRCALPARRIWMGNADARISGAEALHAPCGVPA